MSVGEKVRIADFRRAAQKLRDNDEVVTCIALGKELLRPPSYVRKVLDGLPWLKAELNVESENHGVYLRYKTAVLQILARGEQPSYSSLAKSLSLTERRVRNFVARHPQLLADCGVPSLGERFVHGSVAYFRWHIEALSKQGVRVTPATYAKAYDIDRSWIYKVIQKNEAVAELFGCHHLYRGS